MKSCLRSWLFLSNDSLSKEWIKNPTICVSNWGSNVNVILLPFRVSASSASSPEKVIPTTLVQWPQPKGSSVERDTMVICQGSHCNPTGHVQVGSAAADVLGMNVNMNKQNTLLNEHMFHQSTVQSNLQTYCTKPGMLCWAATSALFRSAWVTVQFHVSAAAPQT